MRGRGRLQVGIGAATAGPIRPSIDLIPPSPGERAGILPVRHSPFPALLFLLFRGGGFVGGDDLVGDHLRNNVVVGHFHGVGPTALGHRREVGSIGEHFRQRHLGFYYGRAPLGFHALDAAAAAIQVTHDVTGVVFRDGNLDVHDGFKQAGLGLLHAFLETLGARQLEGHFRRIDVVVGTVVEADPEVDHRVTGKIASCGRLDDAFFHGGDEVAGNGAAENVIHELEARTAHQGFQLDPAVAVLAMAAGLFLVFALRIGLGANRLPVGNLGRFERDLDVEAPLEF